MATKYLHYSYEQLNKFCMDAFTKFGFKEDEARIITDVLLLSDLYGIESHGMQRLVRYHKGIEKGLIKIDAKPEVVFETPVSAVVDAHDGMGQLAGHFGMSLAIEKAKKTGMAVVTGDGLVGRVYEAGLNYAKVLSMIDSRSSIACLIERTRDNGVLSGQLDSGTGSDSCYMYYLPAVNSVTPGDRVITSGLDSMYPKGLLVGTVTEVSRQTETSSQYIVVSPLVDFTRIEEVLVLRTVIETDKDQSLPVVPDPTPRPTATPDPNATETPVPESTAPVSSAPASPAPTIGWKSRLEPPHPLHNQTSK